MGVINMTFEEVEATLNAVGNPSALTAPYSNLVEAVNELFQSASNGKEAIAAALTGSGIEAAATETFAELAAKLMRLSVKSLIVNCDSIVPTGEDATATYYNVDFGVKVGAMANGDIIVAMRAGTTTTYEFLDFSLGTVPTGVTITTQSATASSNATGKSSMIYACVLHGITNPCEMSVALALGNSTYDNTKITISLTEVSA